VRLPPSLVAADLGVPFLFILGDSLFFRLNELDSISDSTWTCTPQDLLQPNFHVDKRPEAWLAAWVRRTYA
jgi:hypothetical protein